MIEEMNLTILKAGYEQFPKGSPWSGLKDWGINDKITWKGSKATFKLKRLTLEERRKRFISMPLGEPNNKQRLLRVESNKEKTEIGLPPNTLYPVE